MVRLHGSAKLGYFAPIATVTTRLSSKCESYLVVRRINARMFWVHVNIVVTVWQFLKCTRHRHTFNETWLRSCILVYTADVSHESKISNPEIRTVLCQNLQHKQKTKEHNQKFRKYSPKSATHVLKEYKLELESLRPRVVIWHLRFCICVMDAVCGRAHIGIGHWDNGVDNATEWKNNILCCAMATEAQFQSLIHIVYRTKQFSLLVDFKQLSDYTRRHVLISSSVLHSLFPDQRDNDTVSSLQNPKPFHTIWALTNKLRKSFIPYCLDKYTWLFPVSYSVIKL